MPDETNEITLKGIAGSSGVAVAPAYVWHSGEIEVPCYTITQDAIPAEMERLDRAVDATREQLAKLRETIGRRMGEEEARIFDAHIVVLEDPVLHEETQREMQLTLHNVEFCFEIVASRYVSVFDNIEDEFVRERATDIRDVTRRVLRNMLGATASPSSHIRERVILVAQNITPSETAELPMEHVVGIVNVVGGRTSHAVIMARSLEIPSVVGVHGAMDVVHNGDIVLVDGYEGVVIGNPSEVTRVNYTRTQNAREAQRQFFRASVEKPACTPDGIPFVLEANLDEAAEAAKALRRGAKGCGLFRSETIMLRQGRVPSEEEQYAIYRDTVLAMAPHPVVFRTFDIGGDKELPKELRPQVEANPFMGYRAIRLCLDHEEVFREQLRAMLRASAHGKVRIMYPMVSHNKELVRANAMLESCKAELRSRGIPFDEQVEVGSMVETPGAALVMDMLADHCSFFSIGTNDLLQYTLAVDRGNEQVAALYNPCHPGFLRLLRQILSDGRRLGRRVSVCGELAGDPLFAPLLFALGATSLSMSPVCLPEVHYMLTQGTREDLDGLVADVFAARSSQEILDTLSLYRDLHLNLAAELIEPARNNRNGR